MVLTVLSVAYPFARVSPDSTGGAEQVLAALDRALTVAGHRSIVVACERSEVAGTLVPVPEVKGDIDAGARREACARHHAAIATALARWPVDVIHFHGVDFPTYLPRRNIPSLVTLHLPIDWYPRAVLQLAQPALWFNCVSASQHAAIAGRPNLLPPIDNGVDLARFEHRHTKRGFALMLARICPEKGVHIAVAAAKRAGVPLLIGGEIFPYEAHRRYFATEVAPRLDRWRRYIGPVRAARKYRLLATAQCVLIPSLVAETSSLVAREAAAAGTAVVAFARGALSDTVEAGRTGFLVHDIDGMAEAIGASRSIDSETCRRVARRRFSLAAMTAGYFGVYARLAGWLPRELSAAE